MIYYLLSRSINNILKKCEVPVNLKECLLSPVYKGNSNSFNSDRYKRIKPANKIRRKYLEETFGGGRWFGIVS